VKGTSFGSVAGPDFPSSWKPLLSCLLFPAVLGGDESSDAEAFFRLDLLDVEFLS
jgi:hypothetical protein